MLSKHTLSIEAICLSYQFSTTTEPIHYCELFEGSFNSSRYHRELSGSGILNHYIYEYPPPSHPMINKLITSNQYPYYDLIYTKAQGVSGRDFNIRSGFPQENHKSCLWRQ